MPKQFIFLMTDTTRTDMLGCYGNPAMLTPNLDALAGQGLRFEQCYTCQPVCGPARSAIFTGTFPHSNGSWANSMPLGDNVHTVGQRLRDNGIHCAYIGKWHLDGSDYFGNGRCPDGWDPEYWYDMRRYLEEMTPEERVKSRKAATMRQEDLPDTFFYAHRCADRAIRFVQEHRDEDFFLVVSFDEPHGPSLCPRRFWEPYVSYDFPKAPNIWDTLENKPFHQQMWAGPSRFMDRDAIKINLPFFFGSQSYADYEFGRIIVAANQLPSPTYLYTADHGDMLHSHCLRAKGPFPYDECCKVPLIVAGSGVEPGVFNRPVSQIDFTPTILDYFNIPIPRLLEGQSILTTFQNIEAPVRDTVFIEFNRYEVDGDADGLQLMRSAYDGRYKLAINLLTTDELYDLANDPYEMVNLIDSPDTAQIRNALHDRILMWMDDTRDPFRGYYWVGRPWRTDRVMDWECGGMFRQRENEEYEPRQLDYDTGLEMVEPVRVKVIVPKEAKAMMAEKLSLK